MNENAPDWLPDLLSLSGSGQEIIGRLYEMFERDFNRGHPVFRSVPVWWNRRCLDGDPREEGFWHIITKDDAASGERLLDSPRAKRLAWARATIDHAESDDVVVFDYEEGSGRVRTYLWVNDQDYVVILERQNRGHRQG